MKDIQIVPAIVKDIAELARLYDDLNDFLSSGRNYPGWIKGIYPTYKDAEMGFLNESLFVAKINDAIVGTVILNHQPESAYGKANWLIDCDYSHIIVIHTLAVHPRCLSQGIGKRLMDFALRHAKELNMHSIRLDVYENNSPAIKLYEACGYTYIDTVDLGLSYRGLNHFKLYERLLL